MARRPSSGRSRSRNREDDFELIDDPRRPATNLPEWELTPRPRSFDDYDPLTTPTRQQMAIAKIKREEAGLQGVIHTETNPMPTKRYRRSADVIEPLNPRHDKFERHPMLDKVLGCKPAPKRKRKPSGSGAGGKSRKFIPWC